jgi:hypothetical protein
MCASSCRTRRLRASANGHPNGFSNGR